MSDLELGKRRAEELGLREVILSPYYHAEDIHRLLGEGLETFSLYSGVDTWWGPLDNDDDTHQALLIGIRPIAQESEERKHLRRLVTLLEVNATTISPTAMAHLNEAIERAKRFLSEKK